MRNLKIILICTVMVSSMCENDVDPYSEFREIDKDDFGHTLIDTLQLHIQTTDTLQKFLDIMRGIEAQIENDQRESDQKHKEYASACDKDLQAYETELNLLARRKVEYQSQLDDQAFDRQKKQSTFDVKTKWAEKLQNKVDQLVGNRQNEKDIYDKVTAENEYIIYIIGNVKHIFDDGTGNSFLQITDASLIQANQIDDIHSSFSKAEQESEKFTENRGLHYLIHVFSQMTENLSQRVNGDSVKKILDLSELLLRNVEDNQQIQRKSEERRINTFNKQKELLDKDISKAQLDAAQSKAYLLQLDSKIQGIQRDQTDTMQRQDSQQKQQEDRKEECKMEAYFYQQQRSDRFFYINHIQQNRDKKRELVSTVIGLFGANQREFTDYVKSCRK